MNSYTLAGLTQRVIYDKLDDEDFDTTVVAGFINDAQRDIFTEYELPFTEKIFRGNLPSQATLFQFPDDISQLQHVMVDGRDIKDHQMVLRDFLEVYPDYENNQAGPVNRWTLYGGKMIVNRPTDQEYTMTIFYNKVPKTLTDPNDVPELPVEFEEALVLGAYYRVQMREGDTDEALVTQAQYQRKLEQMVSRRGYRISGPIRMKNQQVGR